MNGRAVFLSAVIKYILRRNLLWLCVWSVLARAESCVRCVTAQKRILVTLAFLADIVMELGISSAISVWELANLKTSNIDRKEISLCLITTVATRAEAPLSMPPPLESLLPRDPAAPQSSLSNHPVYTKGGLAIYRSNHLNRQLRPHLAPLQVV